MFAIGCGNAPHLLPLLEPKRALQRGRRISLPDRVRLAGFSRGKPESQADYRATPPPGDPPMPLHHARPAVSAAGRKAAKRAAKRQSGPSPGPAAAAAPGFPPEFLLATDLPRDHFPAAGGSPHAIHQAITEELLLDGNAKQNLATFCQTWEAPEVHALMDLAIDKNLIDKDEYPQTAEIESRCVSMLADLWHAPGAAMGCSTVGSSEAAMLGGMAAKWRWREKRRAAGKPTDRPNMICGAVQICWHKFAKYWDVEIREVGMRPGAMCLEPADVVARADENTIFVVPTMGVTYHGLYEDVAGIAAALDDLERETGLDVPIHVDAASGGFLAPFTAPDHAPWDFRLPRVKSINASGHKFGLAPLGVGWVLWREPADLPDDLVFHVTYLGGDMPTFQINFSRPAITTSCGSAGRATRRFTGRPTTWPGTAPRRSLPTTASRSSTTATRPRGFPPSSGRCGPTRARASRSTTWRTDCGCGAGRCPPIRSPVTSPRRRFSGSSCGGTSIARWPISSCGTSRRRSNTSGRIRRRSRQPAARAATRTRSGGAARPAIS